MYQDLELLVTLTNKKKEIEAQIDELKARIIDTIPEEWEIIWGNKVNVIAKKNFKLKISEVEAMKLFPTATKVSLNMTELKNIPDAHQYLEVDVTKYIQVTTLKDGSH